MVGHDGKCEFILCKLKINNLHHFHCPKYSKQFFSEKLGQSNPLVEASRFVPIYGSVPLPKKNIFLRYGSVLTCNIAAATAELYS
jgi:hypothetical protein